MPNLPIFPLHTVLFPGTPIQLHIFEPRYIQMVQRCLETNGFFGVSLIEEGQEALGPLARPFELGCSASIRKVEPLEDGRMILVAQGIERVRIEEIINTQPYLTASVTEHPVVGKRDRMLRQSSAALLPLIHSYIELVASDQADELSTFRLPDEPTTLAYLTGSLLQIPLAEKQSFLAIESAGELIEMAKHMLRREIALQRVIAERNPAEAIGSFSLN